ncbi:MAG: Uma2 family endonuclease [Pirellula sp.]|jgi:Uma2 family endonuclease
MVNQLVREEPDLYWTPTTFRVAESFEEFTALNPDLRVEQNAKGEIVIMTPTGSEGASRNGEIFAQLHQWAKTFGGKTFDSSVLFTLPDGSKRGPDSSWIAMDRWELLSKEDREAFAPICPDFVIELRSRSDRISTLNEKMLAYIANGVRLGWLIDPFERQAYVYRPNCEMKLLSDPTSLSGEDVLPGFELDTKPIWAV